MSCPACIITSGGVCSLCQCGLKPMAGLNSQFVIELASMLDRGSRDLGRRHGETVLGQAARLVRENAGPETVAHPAAHRVLDLARTRGLVSVGEDGVTSEMLDELYERGLLQAVSFIDGHVMSAAPKDALPPTVRPGSRPAAERIFR